MIRKNHIEPPKDKIAYSAEEMAEMLGICSKTLIESDVPRFRIGRRILFAPEPVRLHVATHSVSPQQAQ